jgi:imidazolonepropionase-like amidohydrolase
MLRLFPAVGPALFCLIAVQCIGADLALVAGAVYTHPERDVIKDAVVLIRDGRIVNVGRRGSLVIPPAAEVVDCSGKFIVAGFYNSHVHFIGPLWQGTATASASQLQSQIREMLTRFGFTSVYDLSSPLEDTVALRRRIESGEIDGPAIRTTGMGFVKKDGTPSYVREQFHMPEIDSADEAKRLVEDRLNGGADGIKIFTGSAGVPGPPLKLAYVQASTSAAHRRGKLVFAHPQHRAGLQNAVDGGIDVLVHTTVQEETWDEALVRRMVRKRMALIPTLKLFKYEAKGDGEPPSGIERWAAVTREQLRRFLLHGGEVLFGTDAGYMSDFDPTEEYELMAQAGMTWRQILASLTTLPANRLGDGRRKGVIRKGWDADLVVLTHDPASDGAVR